MAALLAVCTVAASAQAGQLFPPANIGSNPNIACPNGQVLAWTGEAVACTNPTPGVTVSCPAGQVLAGINSGQAACVTVPACSANQQLNFNGTQFVCTPSTVPTCAAGQVITFNGTSFVCVNEDPAVPTCAAGQFLTYNGVAFQCSGTQPSISIPTCGANQVVTANGSQLICANVPTASGAGCPAQSVTEFARCLTIPVPALANMQEYGDLVSRSSGVYGGSTDIWFVLQCQNGTLVWIVGTDDLTTPGGC